MESIAVGKRIHGIWHVWVKVEGQWYGSVAFTLKRAFTLAMGTHLGPPVSRKEN